jgi:GLPGLI family protein
MKRLKVTIVFTVLILASSCKKTDKCQISSGVIEYNITYLNQDLDRKTRDILPRKMKLAFDERQATNSIDGFLGFYKLLAYTDFHSRKCSTLLKVFDRQYLFKGKREEQMCCFDTMEDMEITETTETKIIAGFSCKKAIILLPSTQETFEIYYTEEIKLKHPNSTNPYKKVKGVLMEFQLDLLYLRMHFVAEKFHPSNEMVQQHKISDQVKMVSRDQMTQILNKLME